MKEVSNTIYIQSILQSIDINPQRMVSLNGKPYGTEFSNPYTQQPSNKMLFQTLEGLIYNTYYCRNTARFDNLIKTPSYQEIEMHLNKLSLSNISVELFDAGWTIEHIDMQGQITAKKSNLKRYVFPGEFVNDSMFHQKPAVDATIRLIARKDHKDPSAGFYYVFGNTLGEDNMSQLVRIYFNSMPEGAPVLINNITGSLNELMIPFNFKCLNHPFYYTRCDTAVLYFDKRYVNLIFEVLSTFYKEIKPFLNADCPAFTKIIAPGISFAENPLKQDESFGTHCSKMIVQGIMNAYNKNLPKQNWFAEVKIAVEQQHKYKNIDILYLNPETKFPYNFPNFSAQ